MLTAHRRENLGEPLNNMFRAIKRIVDETPDIKVLYPIHMNPVVGETLNSSLMTKTIFNGNTCLQYSKEPLYYSKI